MSDQNNAPARGWLPILDAGRRFPTDDQAPAIATSSPSEIGTNVSGQSDPSEQDIAKDWSSAIEDQFGISSPPNQEPSSVRYAFTEVETFAEEETIESLRDRLAYYEHFDSLIRDNVSRSAELFKAVFTEREKIRSDRPETVPTDEDVAFLVEERVHAERQHTQHLLMSLMDEATFLQQRADSFIQRLAEAITEMSAHIAEEDEPVSGA